MFDKGSLCKVELAKMLGLELTGYCTESVRPWEIKELLDFEYQTIERTFNTRITVEVDQGDLSEKNLNIKHEDLVREGDIKVCVKQVEDLIWERAADEYLGKVKALVETIKV
mgnify:CR=1 FL=1